MKSEFLNIRKFFATLIICSLVASHTEAQDLGHLDLKKPVKLHGNLNIQLQGYKASGIAPRQKDFSWMINGNPTLYLFGVQLPFSFLFSNFENRFYQPFNQFGVSPYYKWATLHLGYQNITYSPYTLAGYRMLGAGFDLRPNKLRIGFMYGRLKRSTSIDSSMNANPLFIRPAPTYKRMAYAAKVGYGTSKNYIDLIYFKGWDQENSLDAKLKDSLQPAENTTIGISSKTTIAKNLSWKVDMGLSAYTINKNDAKDTTGNHDNWRAKLMQPFTKDKLSSRYYFAGETSLGYQVQKFGLDLVYKRIDPGYTSMGAYFFQSDLQEYRLANRLMLDSGHLNINTSIGFQKDNLDKQKTSTSKRFIASANISYIPTAKFGLVFNYNNYGITNNPLQLSPGNELFKQVNNSVLLMPFFNWITDKSTKSLNIIINYQSLSTPQSSLGAQPDLNTYAVTTTYNHTWTQKRINVNGSLNYIYTKTAQGNLGSYGGNIGGVVPTAGNKLMINAQASYLNNTFNNQSNGYTARGTLGASIALGGHHSFQLLFSYLKNQSNNTMVIQNFNELNVQVIYGLSF